MSTGPSRTSAPLLQKSGCKLGVSGSVSHMFDHMSVFAFEGLGAEAALDILLGADCEVEDIGADEG